MKRLCLSLRSRDESGFTLVELVVAMSVGLLLMIITANLLMNSLGAIKRLRIEREIRDQGIFAVETIEREFRAVLEYGGVLVDIRDDESTAGDELVVAEGLGVEVSMSANAGGFELSADDGTNVETLQYPSGSLQVRNLCVRALVGNSYSQASAVNEDEPRMIVIEFEMGDGAYGIWRPFKAAFATNVKKVG